jgi:CheY-like chemotaxis protein
MIAERQKNRCGIPSPFDVVVLDYKMPSKDGMEVAKEILQINPYQRIIFASAYVLPIDVSMSMISIFDCV